ncbi:hypothetical protein GCM10023328_18040 [Modestobacter marinus]|uniref:Uncharacterized protein n=1 Tax=Modestobacter marinus TaxID=477641 RepID=A0ABQ2G8E0_9ACTN|nr:hypothetical protein GCM10011589_40300 [Modestobacter marinus]
MTTQPAVPGSTARTAATSAARKRVTAQTYPVARPASRALPPSPPFRDQGPAGLGTGRPVRQTAPERIARPGRTSVRS